MDLLGFPPEIILHIYSYLDFPELDALASLSPLLWRLARDRALQRTRILVVAPSRIEHALFAYGGALRPSIADLVHWGVMRGLGLERRWRMGLYVYSPQSVKQYENSQRLKRTHVRHVLTIHLQRKSSPVGGNIQAKTLRARPPLRELPDSERFSPQIDRSLVPVMRRLKWCIRRDKVARMVRGAGSDAAEDGICARGMGMVVPLTAGNKVLSWIEGRGRGLWKENERVRLAICPGVRKIVKFYESLNVGQT